MIASARSPRVVLIAGLSVVSEAELFARIARAASLSEAARARLVVHLRAYELGGGELLDLATRLREATTRLGASLWVGDRIDVALAANADGVHLGGRSISVQDARALVGPALSISVACHSVADVARATEQGADAVMLSPIFASPGKGDPIGTDALRLARAAIGDRNALLIALGGVTASNAARCFDAGADAVAAIRADLTPLLDRESAARG